MAGSTDELIIAARAGNIEHVNTLITKRQHIDQVVLNRSLLAASENGHRCIVERLLSIGAQVDCNYSTRWTPLMNATRMGFTATVKTLISHGAQVDLLDHHNLNALIYGILDDRFDTVKALLMAGACVTYVEPSRKETVLTCETSSKLSS